MKERQLKNTCLVACIVSILLITSFLPIMSTAKTINDNKNTSQPLLLKANNGLEKVKPHIVFSKNNVVVPLSSSNNVSSEDIVIANRTFSESKPSIIAGGGNMLVAYESEDENGTYVALKTSTDHGQTWSQGIFYLDEELNFTSPSFTKFSEGDFGFGAFLSPDNTSYVFELPIQSISSAQYQSAILWNYSEIQNDTGDYIATFYDFETLDVIPYDDRGTNWIIGTIGDSEFIDEEPYEGHDGQDMPIFLCPDPLTPQSSRPIYYFPEITGCSNISISLGKNSTGHLMVYGVCEIANGTNNNLLFFHGNPNIWSTEDLLRIQFINSSEDLKHPKIIVENSDIFITVETSTQGIILYHSDNYGTEGSWTIHNITSDLLSMDANPVHPMIVINDTYMACTFIESGNLSITKTEINDINWTEPVQINDVNGSAVPGYNFYDIADMHRIAWTDNREGNNDIYYNLDHIPTVDVEVFGIEITRNPNQLFIPTQNLIEIKVRNVGDALATNIPFNVSYNCNGTITTTDYSGLIDSLSVDETKTITRPLFRFRFPEFLQSLINFAGIDSIIVELDPENITEDINENNNIFTYEDDLIYEKIFPTLSQFEDIFESLKPQE